MVDALSRKEVIEYVIALSHVVSNFIERIKQVTLLDVAYEKLRQQVQEGNSRRYWLEEDLLVARGDRMYIPGSTLRKELLRETHDSK